MVDFAGHGPVWVRSLLFVGGEVVGCVHGWCQVGSWLCKGSVWCAVNHVERHSTQNSPPTPGIITCNDPTSGSGFGFQSKCGAWFWGQGSDVGLVSGKVWYIILEAGLVLALVSREDGVGARSHIGS